MFDQQRSASSQPIQFIIWPRETMNKYYTLMVLCVELVIMVVRVYVCVYHTPARSRMTWSSSGRSEKWGILLAHSTRVNSCLSAAWQILVTGSFVCERNPICPDCFVFCTGKMYIVIICHLWLTEFPGLLSVYVSVLGSTASSASRILSTGISSLKLLVDSTSLSLFSFPRCLSSCTAATVKQD